MSPLCYVLAALTAVFAICCILLRRKGRSFEGMLFKFLASFAFVSVATVGYSFSPKETYYFCLVSFALMFGFFGDVLLGIKEIAPKFKTKLIVLGLLFFSLGHICCLCAFVTQIGVQPVTLLIGTLGGIFAFIMAGVLKMKVDFKMRFIMSVYYGLLFLKVSMAGAMIFIKGAAPAYIAALVSGICFVISDTCLGILYFTTVKRKNVLVTAELSTYYPAQVLLAMSVAMM
ncbi:MAG: hypothetical protein IJO36_08015 [Clostridia bacterium]|nr:hypothetical protein [Clostridia bacterium]